MSGRVWRVRPIRAANGRVQAFAVEHLLNTWHEYGAFSTQARAMTVAHRGARNWADAEAHRRRGHA